MEIQVTIDERILFPTLDPEAQGIDVPASKKKLCDEVVKELRKLYPTDTIEVSISNEVNDNLFMVDGSEEHKEVPWVSDVLGDVFWCWSWLAYKK